jgi:hypothetical protein
MAKKSMKKPTKKADIVQGFEPNKMGLAVAALSAVILLLLAVIVTQGY